VSSFVADSDGNSDWYQLEILPVLRLTDTIRYMLLDQDENLEASALLEPIAEDEIEGWNKLIHEIFTLVSVNQSSGSGSRSGSGAGNTVTEGSVPTTTTTLGDNRGSGATSTIAASAIPIEIVSSSMVVAGAFSYF